jgi:uncharacterized membrane protein
MLATVVARAEWGSHPTRAESTINIPPDQTKESTTMKKDTPITLAVATYSDRDGAVADFKGVMAEKTAGAFDHIAVGVITKSPDGTVEVERHDSTAKHLAWGGALVGGALFVLAPPLAPAAIGLGGGASAAGLAGAGGIAGHFSNNIPKDKIREMTDTLDAGDSGLVIVAVNPQGSDLAPMLAGAQKVVIDSTTKGDLEGAYEDAVKKAGA